MNFRRLLYISLWVWFFWMLLSHPGVAQVQTTVTGVVQDATGAPATSGTVVFNLQPQNQGVLYFITGTGIIAPQSGTCGIDGAGNIKNLALSGACQIWGVDLIQPANLTYQVMFFPNAVGSPTNVIPQQCISGVSYSLSTPKFCPVIKPTPQFASVITSPIQNNLIPAADGVFTLGSAGFRYSNIFASNATIGNLFITSFSVGTILAGDGSAVAPSYTFINEPTTGMYRNGAGSLGWTVLGNQRMTLGAGNLAVLGGSPQLQAAGAGGIFAAGNPADVALWRSAAQTWQIGANGSDRNGSLLISPNTQSSPIISARSNTFRTTGNSVEFGHANAAGYGSNLGWETTSGFPFVCFMCEGGTNTNTYRTRGNTASIIRADTGGVLVFGSVASTNADNQSIANNFQLNTTTGNVVSNGTFQGSIGSLSAVTYGIGAANTGFFKNSNAHVQVSIGGNGGCFFETNVWCGSTASFIFGSTVDPNAGAADSNFSRISAGVIGVGTGAQGSTAGEIRPNIANAITGFRINGAAASNHILLGNGTNYVDSATAPLVLLANQGTSTTVLHGNAAGTPTFGSVVQGDVTNGYVDLSTNQNVAGNKKFSNIDSVLWVDGTTFTTLAGCYTALPSTGGACHVPPNYTETLSSSLTLSKNNAGFVFEGPATITMGTNQVIVSPGVNGAFIVSNLLEGGNPLGGAGSAGNTGIQFSYTGNSSAFLIGGALASPATSAFYMKGFSIDLSSAGAAAIGMDLINAHGGWRVEDIFFNGSGAASTQTGLQMDQGGNFTGDGIVANDWFANLKLGINAIGGGGGAVQEVAFYENNFFGGAASSTCYAFGTSFANTIFNSNCSSWTTAISFASASTGNEAHLSSNTTTTDVAFAAGSANNLVVFNMNVPPIVTDAGTNNLAMQAGMTGTINEQGSSGALTGNSADQTLFTYSMPARALGPGKCVDVEAYLNHSTGTTSTTYKLFFGATAYSSNASTGGGQVWLFAHVCNNANSITAQHGSNKNSLPTVAFQSFSPLTSAENTGSIVVIKATFNVANTDQVTPNNFTVALK